MSWDAYPVKESGQGNRWKCEEHALRKLQGFQAHGVEAVSASQLADETPEGDEASVCRCTQQEQQVHPW